VLFLTKYYPPSEGGIERYGHLLCTGLAERHIPVEVIAFAEGRGRTRTERVDGVAVHRLGRHLNLARAPFSFALPAVLRHAAANCDLLHLNSPNPWMELCHLAISGRTRSVVSYHSDVVRPRLFRGAYLPLARRVLRGAAAVIAGSPAYIESSDLLSAHRNLCRVIPYPVDTEYFGTVDPGAVDSIRARHGRFVLFCGRLVYYKGVEYLIRAMDKLQGLKLLVAGRGPEEERLRQTAKALGLDPGVEFLGRVPDDLLRTLYHACECFVLPSVHRCEAFGVVLAEAMACGTPVISTELGTGTSFANLDGETGFVVPPKDSRALAARIALVAEDDELRRALGRNARRRAQELFRKDVVVDQTVRLYGEVLAG
jgi:rhamnosyl/mannosyltransferase